MYYCFQILIFSQKNHIFPKLCGLDCTLHEIESKTKNGIYWHNFLCVFSEDSLPVDKQIEDLIKETEEPLGNNNNKGKSKKKLFKIVDDDKGDTIVCWDKRDLPRRMCVSWFDRLSVLEIIYSKSVLIMTYRLRNFLLDLIVLWPHTSYIYCEGL